MKDNHFTKLTMTDLNFNKVIVFGGTTEGRLIADSLERKGKLICVCVATEYGESFLENANKAKVGRLDVSQMVELFRHEVPTLVIDATHPYAIDVTKNIKEACDNTGFNYLRVSRDSADWREEESENEKIYYFDSLGKMIEWLNHEKGIIYSTLGVKEVKELTKVKDYKSRVFVRVLPVESSLKLCDEAGIDRDHIIDAMGPFSYEQNVEMFVAASADIMLTKDSGKAGGFAEKIRAASKLGMKIAVLQRPEENTENSISITEILENIEKNS